MLVFFLLWNRERLDPGLVERRGEKGKKKKMALRALLEKTTEGTDTTKILLERES